MFNFRFTRNYGALINGIITEYTSFETGFHHFSAPSDANTDTSIQEIKCPVVTKPSSPVIHQPVNSNTINEFDIHKLYENDFHSDHENFAT